MSKPRGQRLIFEFLSIVVAVVLAMGLTEWRQNVLNRKQSEVSFQNILEEVRDNVNDLEGDSSEVAEDVREMGVWLNTDSEHRDTVSMSVGFDFSFLSSSAWEVAKLNQSLTFLDNEKVLDLSKVYEAQGFYEEAGKGIFENMSDLIKIKDTESDEYEGGLTALRFDLNLAYGGIVAYLGIAREILKKYPKTSD